MATPELPRSALRYRRLSAVAAERAVREARRVWVRTPAAVPEVVAQHQLAQARLAEEATALMLAEQGLSDAPDVPLNAAGFVTSPVAVQQMVSEVAADWALTRLVASLVQDAGRTAQSVSQAARPGVGWVRVLTPPSCPRCAILAGRVYMYSDGFLRHPGDDCTTIPVSEGDAQFVPDPRELVATGQVAGISKADAQALRDGADLGQVVNVQRSAAGLHEAGRTYARNGRMTPEAIYRTTSDRSEAVTLLATHGYLAA